MLCSSEPRPASVPASSALAQKVGVAPAIVPAATESEGDAPVMAAVILLPWRRIFFGAEPDEVPAPPRMTAR